MGGGWDLITAEGATFLRGVRGLLGGHWDRREEEGGPGASEPY